MITVKSVGVSARTCIPPECRRKMSRRAANAPGKSLGIGGLLQTVPAPRCSMIRGNCLARMDPRMAAWIMVGYFSRRARSPGSRVLCVDHPQPVLPTDAGRAEGVHFAHRGRPPVQSRAIRAAVGDVQLDRYGWRDRHAAGAADAASAAYGGRTSQTVDGARRANRDRSPSGWSSSRYGPGAKKRCWDRESGKLPAEPDEAYRVRCVGLPDQVNALGGLQNVPFEPAVWWSSLSVPPTGGIVALIWIAASVLGLGTAIGTRMQNPRVDGRSGGDGYLGRLRSVLGRVCLAATNLLSRRARPAGRVDVFGVSDASQRGPAL